MDSRDASASKKIFNTHGSKAISVLPSSMRLLSEGDWPCKLALTRSTPTPLSTLTFNFGQQVMRNGLDLPQIKVHTT